MFSPVIRNGIARVSADRWSAGLSLWDSDVPERDLVVDGIEVTPVEDPPGDVAALLGLADGETVAVRRRRYVLDGKPVLSAVSYLPAALVAGSRVLDADTGPGGVYARLAELGHAPARFREDIIGRMPTAAEADVLRVPPATPVHVITRTAVTADGRPVEVSVMTADASAYVLRYDFEA